MDGLKLISNYGSNHTGAHLNILHLVSNKINKCQDMCQNSTYDMQRWIIILLSIVAAIIAAFVISTYIVFAPFLGMMAEIDEINSMDMAAITTDIMMHPAAVKFAERYPSHVQDTTNLGVGGITLYLIADDGSQLTIDRDTDGNITHITYICFMPNGGSDSISGLDIAEQISDFC